MIPANKKKSYTDVPENLTAQLDSAFTSSPAAEGNYSETNSKSNFEIKTVTKTQKADRSGQINICVPPETKIEWKMLFAKNKVNIKQGIVFAVEHLKNEIEQGDAVLTVGGVMKKS